MIFETREHVEFPLYLTLIVDINVPGRLITFIRIAVTRTNMIILFKNRFTIISDNSQDTYLFNMMHMNLNLKLYFTKANVTKIFLR